jgi:hypothetical protein
MNAAILIASRELRDRGRLFLIAACMAVVPFTAAFAVRENRALAIATVAGFVAAAYTGGLALAMGVSMVGRDLTEKRLSFLFTKPVSAASIWFGKVTAGILTWLGAFVIVILPTIVFANRGWTDMWRTGGGAITAYTLMMSTALFFSSHAASTVLRSRSALVAVDFTLLVLMLIAMFAITRPILLGGGLDVVVRMVVAMGVAVLLVLAIAPVWQIARGRIDPRRSHAAFSTAFWCAVAVIVAVAAAYGMWVISPPLASITDIFMVDQSPSGNWMYVSGQTKNRGEYLASFLVNPATGERERVPVSPWGRVHRAPDGQSIVWMQYDDVIPGRGAFRFYTRRLAEGAQTRALPLVMPMPRSAQLSADGSRIAVTRSNRLEVYELESGRLLGAAPGIRDGDVAAMFFAGPNVVRVVEITHGKDQAAVVREFDMSTRTLSTSATAVPTSGPRIVHFTADGSRVHLRGDGITLDAHTGAVLFTQPVKPFRAPYGAMLRDGSTIVARDSKLHHFDANGTLAEEIAIPVKNAFVVGQLGSSAVVLSTGGNSTADWRTFVVDLAAKKVETVTPGVRGTLTWTEPIVPQFTEDANIVVMDAGHKLVLWNPRSGEKRPFPS